MRLWHFTSAAHLRHIMDDGVLRVTESNIGAPDDAARLFPGQAFRRVGEHVGPDVVWFVNVPEPKFGNMLLNDHTTVDKRLVRFTCDVPDIDVWWWPEWSREQGIDRLWYQ